jgi:hypothetical protein
VVDASGSVQFLRRHVCCRIADAIAGVPYLVSFAAS